MTKKNTIIPDDLIQTIEDFKSNLSGQTVSIHGKDYATVAHRLAIARRNLGSRMKIETEIVSIDKETVVCKATISIGDKVVAKICDKIDDEVTLAANSPHAISPFLPSALLSL